MIIAKQFFLYNVQLFLFFSGVSLQEKTEKLGLFHVLLTELPIDFHTSFSRCTLEIFKFWDNMG